MLGAFSSMAKRAWSSRPVLLTLWAASCASVGSVPVTDSIVELRNYRLRPGQRDKLISLFEREFVESQEIVGAHVLGTFRDLDAPDQYIWLRGFTDMNTRAAALTAFYGGPVWRANRDAANATMIDSDNVHLLRSAGTVLRVAGDRPPIGATATRRAMYVVDIYRVLSGSDCEFATVAARDAHVIGTFATVQRPNNFPALPVRTDTVFVALRRFDRPGTPPPIAGLPAARQTWRLQPTARSLLR
jgi:NIPSNAP